jgi:prevent-host-death family protein
MDAVSPEELREHTGEILDRVRRGDWIIVTDHGHVAAIISPPPSTTMLDGAWRPARIATDSGPVALPHRPMTQATPGTAQDQDGPPGRHRR